MTDSKDKPAPVVAPAVAAAPAAAKPEPKPEVKPEPKPLPPANKHAPAPEPVDAASSPGRGAQVILTGDAQTAARGGAAPDMAGNLAVKEALEGSGEVADGTTPDGSTLTGKPAPDVVVAPPTTDPAA